MCCVIVLTRLDIFSTFKFCTDEIQAVTLDMSEIELGSDIWDEDYFPEYSKCLNFLRKVNVPKYICKIKNSVHVHVIKTKYITEKKQLRTLVFFEKYCD